MKLAVCGMGQDWVVDRHMFLRVGHCEQARAGAGIKKPCSHIPTV